MKEIWRDIPGYKNFYQASSLGRVRSVERTIKTKTSTRTYKSKIIKPQKHNNGYLILRLYKQGIGKGYLVHLLVLAAFKGACPKGCEGDHKDRNRKNNKLSNLRYLKKEENRAQRGEAHGMSKLNKYQVQRIRLMREIDKNFNFDKVAQMFGVCRGTIEQIVYKSSWKHL